MRLAGLVGRRDVERDTGWVFEVLPGIRATNATRVPSGEKAGAIASLSGVSLGPDLVDQSWGSEPSHPMVRMRWRPPWLVSHRIVPSADDTLGRKL